jgi:hypothetical protein
MTTAAAMTDVRGRRARWTGALVIAPGAAAVFAAAVSWAAQSTPTTATTPAVASTPQPPSVAASATARGAAVARELRRTVATRQRRAAALDAELTALTKQLVTIRAANRRAVHQSPGTAANPGSAVTYQPSQQQQQPVQQQIQAPVYQQAPAPAPAPPPVQVVTGASGKP